jgi:sensitive to high expression protein 9
MQPLVRPVARAALGHAWLSSRPGLRLAPACKPIAALLPTKYAACHVGDRPRFFSSQLPPRPDETPKAAETPGLNEASKSPSAESETKPTEEPAKASTPEPETKPTEPVRDSSQEPESPEKHELPSTTDSRRSIVDKKFAKLMDDVQAKLVNASQTLNDITGYTGIEAIKAQNAAIETQLAEAHTRVRTSRLAYKTSNTKRANTQREVTTLLARKDTWSPLDLERFTTLYRADHELEGEVAAAQEALTEAEADEQKLNQQLNNGILKRYHEEQIWSDRIRRASTWGTWGLMGMNFFLFLVLQFVAEPWKRKRLVKGVVAEEKQVLEEVKAELAAVKMAIELAKAEPAPLEQAAIETAPAEVEVELVPQVTDEPVPASLPSVVVEDARKQQSWEEFLVDPESWKAAALDLYSDRMVHLRMRDASILALEGAAAGAAVAGCLAMLFLRS